MAWALVANTIAGDAGTTSSVTTSAIDTTGTKLIVLLISRDNNTNRTVLTDSKSNTNWVLLTYVISGAARLEMYYSLNPTVGSGHTFSNTGTFNFSSIAVAAFSGNAPYLITDVKSSSGSSATTVLPGSITPTRDNELVVCGCGFTGTGSTPLTINDSFTETDELDFSSGVYYGSGMSYKIQTTAAASNPTYTKTGATPFVSIQASFKLSPEISTSWLRN